MLYVSDLDGTLLDAQGKLSNASRELLSGMLDSGLQFTVASARSVWSIGQMLQGLDMTIPVIDLNGAFISDIRTGEHLLVNSLSEAVKHGIYLEIQAAGFLPFISTFDGEKDNLYHSKILNEGMAWYYNDRVALRDPRLRTPRPLEGILDEQVICFTVIDREDKLKPLATRLESLYGGMMKLHLYNHLYTKGWHWLTVHDARSGKATALKSLLGMLGLTSGEVTAFGDDVNDIELFKQAGRAVAVSNALGEVKNKADLIIGSNREDSVAKFIEGEWKQRI
jgi:Cof subfamily protein (haloacid dehalogenase superfamily)